MQALLAGTGKVEHRGVTSDGSNAAAFFTKDLYAQYRTSTASMRRTNWRAVRDGRSVWTTPGHVCVPTSGKCRGGAPVVPPNDDTLGRRASISQIWAGRCVGGAEASTRTPVCRLRPAGVADRCIHWCARDLRVMRQEMGRGLAARSTQDWAARTAASSLPKPLVRRMSAACETISRRLEPGSSSSGSERDRSDSASPSSTRRSPWVPPGHG